MSTFSRVYDKLVENKSLREQGLYTCIPWLDLPKFSTVVPGIEKERYTIVTANSKVGKTQLADFMFMYQPYKFVTEVASNIKIKILYFSLEISKESKILSVLSNRLYTKYNKQVDPQNLESKFQNYILQDDILTHITEEKEYISTFEKTVEIIDSIRNPFGIYKYCREWFEKNGTIHYKTITFDGKDHQIIDYYEPFDKDLYTIIIIDNYNLLTPEKGGDLKSAMEKFSSDYALILRDKFKAHVVAVQQQAAAKESQEFTKSGGLIEQKLRPSPDGLGDSKLTGRDCNYMFGLFAPNRYGIKTWAEYDLTFLKDNHRELSISLNRHGSGFKNVNLLFNGAVNHFKELPKVGTTELQEIYDSL